MLPDLLSKSYAAEFDECWERERTETPVRVFAVRLHATGCSLRETQAILRLIGVERSHRALTTKGLRVTASTHRHQRDAEQTENDTDREPEGPTASTSKSLTGRCTNCLSGLELLAHCNCS